MTTAGQLECEIGRVVPVQRTNQLSGTLLVQKWCLWLQFQFLPVMHANCKRFRIFVGQYINRWQHMRRTCEVGMPVF